MTILKAAPGYFRISIEPLSEDDPKPFEPVLDPVIAWRIGTYAMPITANELSSDEIFAILHPNGHVSYPCFGEFHSLKHLADFINSLDDRLN